MSGLLDEVLAAHGGLERWQAVTALTAHGTFGGLLRSRFRGNRMANVTVRVQLAEQHAVFHGFQKRISGRCSIEAMFGSRLVMATWSRIAITPTPGSLASADSPRNLRWDALDAAYFAGYAWWNYLSTPILLTREGVTITEDEDASTAEFRARDRGGHSWAHRRPPLRADSPAAVVASSPPQERRATAGMPSRQRPWTRHRCPWSTSTSGPARALRPPPVVVDLSD